MNLNAFALSGITIMLTSASIGSVVYLFGKDRYAGKIFGILNIFIFNWGFGSFKIATATTPEAGLLWWRVAYISVIWMPVLFFHFICLFLKLKRKLIVNLSYFYAILCTLAVIYKNAKYFIGRVDLVFSQFYWNKDPQPLHIGFFILIFFGLVVYCMVLLINGIKKADPLRKTQLKYFLLGSGIAWIGGELHFLPTFRLLDAYPYYNFLLPLYPLIMGYAILRHQLMDIEVIIRRAVVFTGLLASVFAILILPTLLIQEYLLRSLGTAGRTVGLIISGIIIILTVRKIENFLINITDKFLFQKKYDYKTLLKTFTSEVLTVLDLSKLVNLTAESLSKIIRLESCAVLIHDKERDIYSIYASLGLKESNQIFDKDTHLINYLLKTHHHLLKDKTISDLPDTGTVKEDLRKINAELVIPIVLHDNLMGVLALGRKKSGEDFTQDDLDILLPLSQTLAVAISNAQYFIELSKTQAEAAQREKMAVIGTLAAGINHEICNPLGIARGQCEAFLLNKRDGIYNDKPETEQLNEALKILELVIKETDRATSITKKLSTFAKPSKGEVADDVDLSKELDEVIALVGYELRLDKIELVKNIPPYLPHIRADKKQIQEIFFNLIRNAAQAISESGRISVSAYEMNSNVVVDIADTGCGIPQDKLGMIFNPFYTTKEPGKGTGLGLFIVRQVVERNKGKISLKSKVGEGTTFTLEFPKTY